MSITIGITGGTGFVGTALKMLLLQKGHRVIIFTRQKPSQPGNDQLRYSLYNPRLGTMETAALEECDHIVNLAGANVAGSRWTKSYKKEIRDSRIADTQFLVQQLNTYGKRCQSFVTASATGYYGADLNGGQAFAETDNAATDFLGQTCADWEAASTGLNPDIKRVVLRIGIVLGKDAGALPEFIKPLKMGVMPLFGNGKQTISWIHLNDFAGLIHYAIENESISGIYNAVAPTPLSEQALMKAIQRTRHKLAVPVPIPAFVLKMMLGEMSTEILKSYTVSANKIVATGFNFQFPNADAALKDLIK